MSKSNYRIYCCIYETGAVIRLHRSKIFQIVILSLLTVAFTPCQQAQVLIASRADAPVFVLLDLCLGSVINDAITLCK